MDKHDIELLIKLLQQCLEQRPEDMREISSAEVAMLKQHHGDFDMYLGDYAVLNLKKREFFRAVETASPGQN